MKTFSYEKPALIDMQEDSAQGRADCVNGSGVDDCAYGSCVASAQCAEVQQTGYCWNGKFACGGLSGCYTCCSTGNRVTKGVGMGTTNCSCSDGTSVAMNCYTGWGAGYECTSGSRQVQC